MNIFVLAQDPKLCAQMHCDKHVVKMILETAQLLSTAHRVLDGEEMIVKTTGLNKRIKKEWHLSDDRDTALYKATHINHPSAVWARENSTNYSWLYSLFIELNNEYTYRYGKIHKCMSMREFLRKSPNHIPHTGSKTPYPLTMPDDCKLINQPVTESFRNYYKMKKSEFAKWTRRDPPGWWNI
jgi:hypothetical protein